MPIKMSHLASLSVITNSLWIHASSRRTLFACWSSTFWSWSFTLPRLGGDPFRHRQSQHAVRGRHRCAGGCLARSICQERCEVSVLILSGHTLPHCLSNHELSWGGLVARKIFSVPPAAKLCVRPPNVLKVQECARGPLSPCQVW